MHPRCGAIELQNDPAALGSAVRQGVSDGSAITMNTLTFGVDPELNAQVQEMMQQGGGYYRVAQISGVVAREAIISTVMAGTTALASTGTSLVVSGGQNLATRMGVSAATQARIMCPFTQGARLYQPYQTYQQFNPMTTGLVQAQQAIERGDYETAATLFSRGAFSAATFYGSLRESMRFGRALATMDPQQIRGYLQACFTGDHLVLTRRGLVRWDELTDMDKVLAKPEDDPYARAEFQSVEKIFQTTAPIWHVHLRAKGEPGGVSPRILRTTGEHPFYVVGKKWVAAKDLQPCDRLRTHDNEIITVEEVLDAGYEEKVYNCRVADYHTYFVTGDGWDFDVWAHNTCEIGSYNRLRTDPGRPNGYQVHHLNQNAAYRDVIPRGRGESIYLQGGTNQIGSEHYLFHQRMDQFWARYKTGGDLFGTNPTNRDYDRALRASLRAAGVSENEIRRIARAARQQRVAYGQLDNMDVPRIPGT